MTATTLARRDYNPDATQHPMPEWVALMVPVAELAREIAATGFVPGDYRNKPAEITACILYGAELGLKPMQSLAKIDMVKGRPAPRAEIGRALALAAGHDLWVEESTNTRVTVAGQRRGSQRVQTVTWTMDDAKRAGIAGNPAYARYPRQMLLARASAELVRAMCPEVLGGIVMFAEETGEDIDATIPALAPVVPQEPPRKRRRTQTPDPTAVLPAAVDGPVDTAVSTGPTPALHTAPVDDDDKPTEAQTKLVMAAFKDEGMEDRDDRLAATSAFIGRPVTSWSDVTRSEASTVIDGLERLKAGALAFQIDTDGQWHAEPVDTDDLET